jgi:serine-type D-Ala-D-Ala carboxypeptidase (penicillin-binding protein 5/6)
MLQKLSTAPWWAKVLAGFCFITNVAWAAPRVPAAPTGDAKSFALVDFHSGKVLAGSNEHERLDPASLTKMMTAYVVDKEIKEGRLKLGTMVHISNKAWQTEGSRMFVEVNTEVSVQDLLRGVIIQSGNDACIALAEHIAGTEEAFVNMMNQEAKQLGMKNTQFQNATGLPHPDHYTTAYDLSLLARSLIKEFPDSYKWHSEKWYTFQGIKQPNRNRLLWRENFVDGIKTGHSSSAGYCLAASGAQNGMRLVSIVMGSESDNNRTDLSQRLLRYGFRFFETHKVFASNKPVRQPRIWMGSQPNVPVGVASDFYVTLPQGSYDKLKATITLENNITAPVQKGAPKGKVVLKLEDQVLAEKPLVVLKDIEQGSVWTRMSDFVAQKVNGLFGSSATVEAS